VKPKQNLRTYEEPLTIIPEKTNPSKFLSSAFEFSMKNKIYEMRGLFEGEKNTRRGVELCFEKFFVSPKN
jgi:hypothetical protein